MGLTVVGLLSPLGKVNTVRKDFVFFHYGLGGVCVCVCVCVLVNLGPGEGKTVLTSQEQTPYFLTHWFSKTPTGLAVLQKLGAGCSCHLVP